MCVCVQMDYEVRRRENGWEGGMGEGCDSMKYIGMRECFSQNLPFKL